MFAVAAAIAAGGAVAWSRTVADSSEPTVLLDQPGEFVDPASTNERQDGNPLPAFELLDADGRAVTMAPDGRPMVVNLWYSTCPPCAREITAFAAVERQVGDRVRFVGVNPYDSVEDMERFANDRGVGYELLRDPDFAVGDGLGVVQFPVTLFVSAAGDIVAQTGVLTESELREHVARLLA